MFLKIGDYVSLGPAKYLVEDKEGSLGTPNEDLQKQKVGMVTGVVGSCVTVRHGDTTSTYDPLSLWRVTATVEQDGTWVEGNIKGWDNFGAGKKILVTLTSDKKTYEYTPNQIHIMGRDPRVFEGHSGGRRRRRTCRRLRGGMLTQKQMALNRLAAQGLLTRNPTVRQLAIEKLGAIPSGPLRRRSTRRRR
jgi:hypothetical protein